MTRHRIPTTWTFLRPGDKIGSRLPYHRIEQAIEQMTLDGWEMETEPSQNGYWVICKACPPSKSPPVQP